MEKYGPPRGPEGRRPDGRRPEADDDRPRPEVDRREMAREGDRRPGPERDGDRPRGPEGDRMERGDRPEGRGFGGSPYGGRPMSPLVRLLAGMLNEAARTVASADDRDAARVEMSRAVRWLLATVSRTPDRV